MNPENRDFIAKNGIEKFREKIEELHKKLEEKYPLKKSS